jgi:hypothetical protein
MTCAHSTQQKCVQDGGCVAWVAEVVSRGRLTPAQPEACQAVLTEGPSNVGHIFTQCCCHGDRNWCLSFSSAQNYEGRLRQGLPFNRPE